MSYQLGIVFVLSLAWGVLVNDWGFGAAVICIILFALRIKWPTIHRE